MDRRTENRWSNEINDELDKIAKQSENEQKAYESKLDRLRKEFDSKPSLKTPPTPRSWRIMRRMPRRWG